MKPAEQANSSNDFDPSRATRAPWAMGLLAFGLLLAPTGPLSASDQPILAANPLQPAVVATLPLTLDATAKQHLLAAGSHSSFFDTRPNTDLCPNPAAATDITRTLSAANPNIGVQTLVVAPMPPSLIARGDRDLVLYNLIHKFRTMEGLRYFSATHGKIRTLFTASHVVAAPVHGAWLADPQYPAIELTHTLLLEQDDSTFGKNLYTVTVKGLEGGAFELTMSNVAQVWYGIVPVLKPGALNLTMVIQASADGNYLYFYGNVGVSVTKVFGLEGKVRTSFYNRILALYTWYADQAAHA